MVRARLSENQGRLLEQAYSRHIASSRIIVNINLREQVQGKTILDRLFETERILNIFEIAHAHQDSWPVEIRQRMIAEYRIYGQQIKIQRLLAGMSNTEHPVYGQLSYIDDPIKLAPLGHYGLYRFLLRSEVNKRSTFAPNDSFNVEAWDFYDWDNIRAILAHKVERKPWFHYVNRQEVPISENGFINYIEAQILGGVFLNHDQKDVDRLYYPETDRFDDAFYKRLVELGEKYQIELRPY